MVHDAAGARPGFPAPFHIPPPRLPYEQSDPGPTSRADGDPARAPLYSTQRIVQKSDARFEFDMKSYGM